jgi:hypothetical protein
LSYNTAEYSTSERLAYHTSLVNEPLRVKRMTERQQKEEGYYYLKEMKQGEKPNNEDYHKITDEHKTLGIIHFGLQLAVLDIIISTFIPTHVFTISQAYFSIFNINFEVTLSASDKFRRANHSVNLTSDILSQLYNPSFHELTHVVTTILPLIFKAVIPSGEMSADELNVFMPSILLHAENATLKDTFHNLHVQALFSKTHKDNVYQQAVNNKYDGTGEFKEYLSPSFRESYPIRPFRQFSLLPLTKTNITAVTMEY